MRKSTIDERIEALELFFSMNDKVEFQEDEKDESRQAKDHSAGAWTRDQIKQMLESTSSLRNKAIILTLVSTGCRPGAFTNPSLRLKHVSEMPNNCKSITFYERAKE